MDYNLNYSRKQIKKKIKTAMYHNELTDILSVKKSFNPPILSPFYSVKAISCLIQ